MIPLGPLPAPTDPARGQWGRRASSTTSGQPFTQREHGPAPDYGASEQMQPPRAKATSPFLGPPSRPPLPRSQPAGYHGGHVETFQQKYQYPKSKHQDFHQDHPPRSPKPQGGASSQFAEQLQIMQQHHHHRRHNSNATADERDLTHPTSWHSAPLRTTYASQPLQQSAPPSIRSTPAPPMNLIIEVDGSSSSAESSQSFRRVLVESETYPKRTARPPSPQLTPAAPSMYSAPSGMSPSARIYQDAGPAREFSPQSLPDTKAQPRPRSPAQEFEEATLRLQQTAQRLRNSSLQILQETQSQKGSPMAAETRSPARSEIQQLSPGHHSAQLPTTRDQGDCNSLCIDVVHGSVRRRFLFTKHQTADRIEATLLLGFGLDPRGRVSLEHLLSGVVVSPEYASLVHLSQYRILFAASDLWDQSLDYRSGGGGNIADGGSIVRRGSIVGGGSIAETRSVGGAIPLYGFEHLSSTPSIPPRTRARSN
eukprot:NODE_1001_length_1767_cov_27.673458_g884_i0.p1 GENE.NODE_1001_length_1767_cov_27.673458_g884_i0~~NODE_1001_length_1767_cov_27.673458_g884_i0.p1  ORF type:complete len:481 (+),score=45.96 NODE_1001_length_1767_cov_27.673458_g884_i0:107-1549(+)